MIRTTSRLFLSNPFPGTAVKPHSPCFYYENPVHDILTALDLDALDVVHPFYRPSESRPDLSQPNQCMCQHTSNYQHRKYRYRFPPGQLALYYLILDGAFSTLPSLTIGAGSSHYAFWAIWGRTSMWNAPLVYSILMVSGLTNGTVGSRRQTPVRCGPCPVASSDNRSTSIGSSSLPSA